MSNLTESQQKIKDLLDQGFSSAQIAKRIKMKEPLVKAQITRIFNKNEPNCNIVDLEPSNSSVDKDKIISDTAEVIKSYINNQNPLLIMGTTMQFIRLCGGRLAAHQAIESVVEAFSMFNNVPVEPLKPKSNEFTKEMEALFREMKSHIG